MKKLILLPLFVAMSGFIAAQTEFEAARFNNPEISGSARYSGLAGAYGALGGDASAIKDNPAGLGVYRSSELSFTGGLIINQSASTWYNTNSSANSSRVNFNNFSYVWNIPAYGKETGLLNSNFAFTFNKGKNFMRETSMQGAKAGFSLTDVMVDITNGVNYRAMTFSNNPYTNNPYNLSDVGWLSILGYQTYLIDTIPGTKNTYHSLFGKGKVVNPYSYVLETGSINEYGFSWGGNFDNKLFLGANLNMVTLDYRYVSQYKEKVSEAKDEFKLTNYINQSGSGVNLKVGAIYLPTNSLRLGFSAHTPTAYTVSISHSAAMTSTYRTGEPEKTDIGTDEFQYIGPWQLQASAAYLFGKKGLISFEYDFITNTTSKYRTREGIANDFKNENEAIQSDLKNNHVFKLGAEYKLTDNVALRGGYANVNGINPTSTAGKPIYENSTYTNTEYFLHKGSQYYTLGVGYREASWFFDVAYVMKREKNDFYNFDYNYFGANSISPASVNNNTHNIVATLGFRF